MGAWLQKTVILQNQVSFSGGTGAQNHPQNIPPTSYSDCKICEGNEHTELVGVDSQWLV